MSDEEINEALTMYDAFNNNNYETSFIYYLFGQTGFEAAFKPDKSSNLSNGDIVTLGDDEQFEEVFSVSEMQLFTYKLSAKAIKYKVSGLKAAETFDPFDDWTLSYDGFTGYAYLNANYNGDLDSYMFEFDKTEGLSNGDKIKIILYDNYYGTPMAEYCAEYLGKVPSAYEKIITVSGIKEPEGFDPFADWKFNFTGCSGYGKLESSYSGILSRYMFSFESPDKLSNGDKIKITLDNEYYGTSMEEYCTKYYGKYPSSYEKTITVSGLPEALVFDPFEAWTITFDGYSTAGSLQKTYSGEINSSRFKFDKTSDLSNGDIVTVTLDKENYGMSMEEYCVKNYGKIPSAYEKTYTVSGLTEPEVFNPFDDMTIDFNGVNTKGKLTNTYTGNFKSYIKYSATTNLSNGDTVTVTFDWNGKKTNSYGMIPSVTTKEYTVSGLPVRVTSMDELKDGELEAYIKNGEEYTKNNWTSLQNYNNFWGGTISLESIEYSGYYLLDRNNSRDFVLVYKYDVYGSYGNAGAGAVGYGYVYYSDLQINQDGSIFNDIASVNYMPRKKTVGVYSYAHGTVKCYMFESLEEIDSLMTDYGYTIVEKTVKP